MAALAGHAVKIYAVQQADGDSAPSAVSDYTQIGVMDNFDFSEQRTNLDKTSFGDSGARERFLGLKDGSISLSGYYDSSDGGLTEIRSGFTGAADAVVWIMVAWTGDPADGTDHVKCTVEEYTRSAEVDGRVEVSASLNFNGAPAAGPTS